MRAINRIIFLQFIFITSAMATDEYWGIYQIKYNLNKSNFIFSEYVRRDYEGLFDKKNLDLVRLSYGGKFDDWTYQLGLAYVNFKNSSDERRAHQFFVKNFSHTSNLSSFVRLGLEQRSFISDDELYWRGRIRGQMAISVIREFGFSFYDEMLFAMNGPNKFYQGLNENRLGLGLRYRAETFEVLIFQTYAKIKTLKSEVNSEWIQLQTIFSF